MEQIKSYRLAITALIIGCFSLIGCPDGVVGKVVEKQKKREQIEDKLEEMQKLEKQLDYFVIPATLVVSSLDSFISKTKRYIQLGEEVIKDSDKYDITIEHKDVLESSVAKARKYLKGLKGQRDIIGFPGAAIQGISNFLGDKVN